jgi:hypothetical protein
VKNVVRPRKKNSRLRKLFDFRTCKSSGSMRRSKYLLTCLCHRLAVGERPDSLIFVFFAVGFLGIYYHVAYGDQDYCYLSGRRSIPVRLAVSAGAVLTKLHWEPSAINMSVCECRLAGTGCFAVVYSCRADRSSSRQTCRGACEQRMDCEIGHPV